MRIRTAYVMTKHEEGLAQDALAGLEFLPQDWYRDENPEKGHLNYGELPNTIRTTTEDIRWMLRPSGSGISTERFARIMASLATLRQIVELQSNPEWWSLRHAPTHLAETRQTQLSRIDRLISEITKLTDEDSDEEDDD